MFDKMFETIARKQLQENAFTRFNRMLNNRRYEKLGAIVTFPNGTRGLDIVKVQADSLKKGVLFTAATIGAGIIAGKLGSMDH